MVFEEVLVFEVKLEEEVDGGGDDPPPDKEEARVPNQFDDIRTLTAGLFLGTGPLVNLLGVTPVSPIIMKTILTISLGEFLQAREKRARRARRMVGT